MTGRGSFILMKEGTAMFQQFLATVLRCLTSSDHMNRTDVVRLKWVQWIKINTQIDALNKLPDNTFLSKITLKSRLFCLGRQYLFTLPMSLPYLIHTVPQITLRFSEIFIQNLVVFDILLKCFDFNFA